MCTFLTTYQMRGAKDTLAEANSSETGALTRVHPPEADKVADKLFGSRQTRTSSESNTKALAVCCLRCVFGVGQCREIVVRPTSRCDKCPYRRHCLMNGASLQYSQASVPSLVYPTAFDASASRAFHCDVSVSSKGNRRSCCSRFALGVSACAVSAESYEELARTNSGAGPEESPPFFPKDDDEKTFILSAVSGGPGAHAPTGWFTAAVVVECCSCRKAFCLRHFKPKTWRSS
jgi:hypothetical protein